MKSSMRAAHIFRSLIVFAALAAVVLRFELFSASIARIPTTTDEAIAAMMASAIASGARPLLFWGAPYQFPVESYLMAPFASMLPPDAFGARFVLAILGALAVTGFALLVWRSFPAKSRWPALLLVLLPSAYVSTLQVAYFIPEHTATMTFAWLIPLLGIGVLHRDRGWLAAVVGLVSGIALSTHLLSLPFIVPLAISVCLGTGFRSAARNTLLFIPGFLLGLLPYLATYQEARAAAGSVTASYPIGVAIERFFSPLLNENLTTLLGLTLCPFPDFGQWPGRLPYLVQPVLIAFWVLLGAATLIRVRALVQRWGERRWPHLEIDDVFVGAIWACLFAYVVSKRGMAGEYRYLLPVAWYTPFLIGVVYRERYWTLKGVAGAFAIVLAVVNVFNTRMLVDRWEQPKFAHSKVALPKLGRLVSYLERHDISHCYATFWDANRFTYETGQRITCSQPFNERFPGWPLPFEASVRESPRVAYVLSNTPFAKYRAEQFQKLLNLQGIAAKVRTIGFHIVFHGFSRPGEDGVLPLVEAVPAVEDRENGERTIEYALDSLRELHRITIHLATAPAPSTTVRVEASEDGITWQHATEGEWGSGYRIVMHETHPILADNAREFSLPAIHARRIRVHLNSDEEFVTKFVVFGR